MSSPGQAPRAIAAAKPKKSLKGYWANLKDKARAERIKKMLAGRGLKPKVKKPPTARGLALKKALKASWARMTPGQRAERIAKMQKGRGLKLKPGSAARTLSFGRVQRPDAGV